MDKICDEIIKNKNRLWRQKSRPIVDCPEKLSMSVYKSDLHNFQDNLPWGLVISSIV